ncbi:hypothetical protein [Persicirhabdus sediminis]|uniref:Uncharacterized protein n=1 Tax=Persicirhabdus sediminis TaxID=454144 RepID=A0A8J7SM30_9BACT|nr:hypothetical protein [Persicirhabdus sediminis]MBK1792716.1 hypothetical protein [Persicirhabdus sediminis]
MMKSSILTSLFFASSFLAGNCEQTQQRVVVAGEHSQLDEKVNALFAEQQELCESILASSNDYLLASRDDWQAKHLQLKDRYSLLQAEEAKLAGQAAQMLDGGRMLVAACDFSPARSIPTQWVSSSARVPSGLPELTLADGRSLKNVKSRDFQADGFWADHDEGSSFVSVADLAESDKVQFGYSGVLADAALLADQVYLKVSAALAIEKHAERESQTQHAQMVQARTIEAQKKNTAQIIRFNNELAADRQERMEAIQAHQAEMAREAEEARAERERLLQETLMLLEKEMQADRDNQVQLERPLGEDDQLSELEKMEREHLAYYEAVMEQSSDYVRSEPEIAPIPIPVFQPEPDSSSNFPTSSSASSSYAGIYTGGNNLPEITYPDFDTVVDGE